MTIARQETTVTTATHPVRLNEAGVGDYVIYRYDGMWFKIQPVEKATSRGLYVNSGWYGRDGRPRQRRSSCLLDPTPDVVAKAEYQAEEARRRKEAQREDEARRQQPEWRVASRLLSMREEDVVQRLGPDRLAQIGRWLDEGEAAK